MKTSKFKTPQGTESPKARKHLNADALINTMRSEFAKVDDPRAGSVTIPIEDILMSAFAVFMLKDPSLLAFDNRRHEKDPNLKRVFGIQHVPCDTQIRGVLDLVDPGQLHAAFKRIFSIIQRGKALEQMRFLGMYYLISCDGTGYYYSMNVNNDVCLEKKIENGKQTAYYQQFFGAALVHPDFREVIPFCPEPIVKQDGATKNDCERSAARRFMQDFRREHPHLKAVILEDALHSNAPHIRDLVDHNLHFIIGAKESDHGYLWKRVFEEEKTGRSTNITMADPINAKKKHNFFFVNRVPLNKSNPDVLVNFVEYWDISLDKEGNEIRQTQYAWVTDLEITAENVFEIMRGGRARWKIENETFNTLKNQGYHLEHNFGLGEKNLSLVFMTLTMLAFMVDQTQQLCCGLFRAAWEKAGSKRALWEKMRSIFVMTEPDSMKTLWKMICFGFKKPDAATLLNTG